ncbi:MAG: dihydropteroate synthase [Bacteroidota bacterium]
MKEVLRYPQFLEVGKTTFDFSHRTYVMGILNVTPDSFSDGGKYLSVEAAVARGLEMVEQGADIIDIGGESTRPKGVYGETHTVTADEELRRILPVIDDIRKRSDIIISVDTTKSVVAEQAVKSGASIINDISGLKFDPKIASVAAQYTAALIVMHIQGTPETMQLNPQYGDVVHEVFAELQASVEQARKAGVQNIIIDPGIGFGKNLEHNLMLLKHLGEFRKLDLPVLIGTSRKGFIGTILNNAPVDDRFEGTAATVAAAIMNGANIIRVHDVKAMKRVAMVIDAIQHAQ